MAEIAVSFLLNELAVFLHDEKSLLGGVRKEAEYIRAKLEQMKAFLSVADAKEERDPLLQVWIKQVRDVVYDTEDILDEFILRLANNHRLCIGSLAYHQIASKIQRIRPRIDNIFQNYGGFDHGSSSTVINNAWLDRRWDALLIDEGELVGIEQQKQQLISWLVKGDSRLKVVSVAGMGGSGKTTLVKKVYEDTELKRHFRSHVWITVSQSFEIKELLKQVIDQLYDEVKQPVPEVKQPDSHGLKELVKDFLQQRRYVLVLDDVWSLNAWDAIEIALPDNRHGSRVLLTTREGNVASTCCLKTRGKNYTMPALSPEESWTLFCRKVFQGSDCPQPLYTLSKCILKKCGGLPLAIVAMGDFLATKDRRIEEWDMVRRSLGDELESNDRFTFMTRILLLSYFDLPSHLKVCLLYLSVFPEDYEIEKMRLIRLWIAEGFVQVQEGKTLEEVAENYLNNLSREQSIGTTISGHDAKWRCLAIQNSVENIHTSESNSRLRSLLIFKVVNPLSNSSISMFLSSRLLKVLDLRGAPLAEIPSLVFTLIHLRYLSMRETNVSFVPKSIKKLRNLETLDLKQTNVIELPAEILRLRKLRHLLVYSYKVIDIVTGIRGARGFKAPYTTGDLISLQKLSYIEAGEINGSGGSCNAWRKGAAMTVARPYLVLGAYVMEMVQGHGEMYGAWDHDIVKESLGARLYQRPGARAQRSEYAPQFLRLLELRGRLEKLPQWIPSLQSLVKLGLTYSQLRDDPLQSLGALPNLVLLGFFQGYEGERLTLKAGGFQRLKVLILGQLKGLRSLTVEDGAMPHLEELHFHDCKLVDKLPSDIQHLTNLRYLGLVNMPNEMVSRLFAEGLLNIAHIPKVLIGTRKDNGWKGIFLGR
ncbi:hypothetical protein RJ639_012269 [Escallonia herrerae]|uniref:Disease resistance protein RPM1-like n=1 Tax=Escallonia herrerae TaxID=1293975 RepID=A0AA88VMY4_9ASTE|nr:hypothetical protein RJ639_012269 [Escallonia herrerae]